MVPLGPPPPSATNPLLGTYENIANITEPGAAAPGPSRTPEGTPGVDNAGGHLNICDLCGKKYNTFRGLCAHKRLSHKEASHAAAERVHETRKHSVWDQEELRMMAAAEAAAPPVAELPYQAGGKRREGINQYLCRVLALPHRDVESIKSKRKRSLKDEQSDYYILLADAKSRVACQREASQGAPCTRAPIPSSSSGIEPSLPVIPSSPGLHRTVSPAFSAPHHNGAAVSAPPWASTLFEAIDYPCDTDIRWDVVTPGCPSAAAREALDEEYLTWSKHRFPAPPSRRTFREKGAVPPAAPRPSIYNSSKQRRRANYRRTQDLWKRNRTRCANEVLTGQWKEESSFLPPADMFSFWGDMFSKPSEIDRRSPTPVSDPIWQLMSPVTDEELANTISKSKSSAPGPDGIKLSDVKKVPRQELISHFNTWLFAGYQPSCLMLGRTVLPPKVKGTRDPAQHRPITIVSIIGRLLHKILAARLEQLLPVSVRQKGFRQWDGIGENVWMMRALLKRHRVNKKGLCLAFLDVRKAFDSVSHQSLLLAAERIGIPPPLLNYIEELYAGSSTIIEYAGARSNTIKARRGVKQGDPLSPVLFNCVMDWVLAELPTSIGINIDEKTSINHLAFADDVVLVASTKAGLHKLTQAYQIGLERVGLSLNVSKSATLTLEVDRKLKKWYVKPSAYVSLCDGTKIPALTVSQSYKYLGIDLSAYGARLSTLDQLRIKLGEVTRAPLKPQQRMSILREFLLPSIQHRLILSSTSKGFLLGLDKIVRRSIRGWLRFPKDTTVSFFHASPVDGGLGVPSLSAVIPELRRKRILNLHNTVDPAVRAILDDPLFCHQAALASRGARSSVAERRHQAQLLHSSVDGRGLSNASGVAHVHNWVTSGTSLLTGRNYVGALKIRGSLHPTKVRNARWNVSKEVTCDACRRNESLGHILQVCPRTWGPRISRHNHVAALLAKTLEKRGFTIITEPAIPTPAGIRRPDLVSFHPKHEFASVIDTTIVSDNADLEAAHAHKVEYYKREPAIEAWVKASTNCKSVEFSSLTLSWRGCMSIASADYLSSRLRLPQSVFTLLGASTVEGSYLTYVSFSRGTYRQPFHP